jgi:hypothetical protein
MPWDSDDYIACKLMIDHLVICCSLSYLDYEQILGPPAGDHVFPSARQSEVTITMTPKAAQMNAGSLVRLCQGVLLSISLM